MTKAWKFIVSFTLLIFMPLETFGNIEMIKLINNFGRGFIDNSNENIIFSSVSIFNTFLMLYNSADLNTQKDIANFLSLNTATTLNLEDFHYLLLELSRIENINIASSLWYEGSFRMTSDYITKMRKLFLADIFNTIDPEKMNEWIKKKTKGLIKEVVSKDIRQQCNSYLACLSFINTLYFRNLWREPFNKYPEDFIDFHNSDGSISKIQAMEKIFRGGVGYIDTKNFYGITIPLSNKDFCFIAIMGKEAGKNIYFLSAEEIRWILDNAEENKVVKVRLPLFSIDYRMDLKRVLESKGYKGIVQGFLEGVFEEGRKGYEILESVHRSKISVNESGIEAGAVTTVTVGITSIPSQNFIEFTLDKPFYFCIVYIPLKLKIFEGKIEILK